MPMNYIFYIWMQANYMMEYKCELSLEIKLQETKANSMLNS